MFGIFKKFKEGFARTTQSILTAVGGVFGFKTINAETLESLEEALYGADFGVETTTEIIEEIRQAYKRDKELRGQDAAGIGARVLERVLEGAEGRWAPTNHKPEVICLVGVNGSGKTTTAAKLSYLIKEQGSSVLLGACDTFRAAANEQIQTWAKRLDVEWVSSHQGADAAAVAYDSHSAAKGRETNVLVLDTAGRLHNKTHLMEELKKICRVLQKQDAEAPHHRWLVLDGSLGTNSIEQARVFHEAIGLTGLIITKLDGTSRGGALVGIYRTLNIPIYYIGLGETPESLQPFSVKEYVHAIFGQEH